MSGQGAEIADIVPLTVRAFRPFQRVQQATDGRAIDVAQAAVRHRDDGVVALEGNALCYTMPM